MAHRQDIRHWSGAEYIEGSTEADRICANRNRRNHHRYRADTLAAGRLLVISAPFHERSGSRHPLARVGTRPSAGRPLQQHLEQPANLDLVEGQRGRPYCELHSLQTRKRR
jgi:hypothetical protein